MCPTNDTAHVLVNTSVVDRKEDQDRLVNKSRVIWKDQRSTPSKNPSSCEYEAGVTFLQSASGELIGTDANASSFPMQMNHGCPEMSSTDAGRPFLSENKRETHQLFQFTVTRQPDRSPSPGRHSLQSRCRTQAELDEERTTHCPSQARQQTSTSHHQ